MWKVRREICTKCCWGEEETTKNCQLLGYYLLSCCVVCEALGQAARDHRSLLFSTLHPACRLVSCPLGSKSSDRFSSLVKVTEAALGLNPGVPA